MRSDPKTANVRPPVASSLNIGGALWSVGLFSAVANLLMLTGPLFMLQVYDRVLMSRSVPTLLALGLIVAVLYLFYGVLEYIRGRVMTRIGKLIDSQTKRTVFDSYVKGPLRGEDMATHQPLQDLHQTRRFLSSPMAVTLFDLPWIPIYLLVVFLLHPVLGWVAVAGSVTLILVAVLNERLSATALTESQQWTQAEYNLAHSVRDSAESVAALGLTSNLRQRFDQQHVAGLTAGDKAASFATLFGSITRASRLAIQSLILGTGAYLAIGQEISPGSMIAASIIFARALAPVEQTIAQWRSIALARASWQRLKEAIASTELEDPEAVLPLPLKALQVRQLAVAAPGRNNALIKDVNFALQAGEGMGILGNSGSGKSTLAKALVGAWSVGRGEVRLDGATIDQWPQEVLARAVGYMSQEVSLFNGTISENIARFSPGPEFADIMAAGQLSGAHAMILGLPDGYDTQIGQGGIELSAGQRQRIALARAVFRTPFLVVLDEPNSNLDAEGDAALHQAIVNLKQAGSIVIVIAHRIGVLKTLDKLMVIEGGAPQMFGPRDSVLAELQKRTDELRKRGDLKVVN